MIHFIYKLPEKDELVFTHGFDAALIKRAEMYWLDFDTPTEIEIEALKSLKFHPLTIEDCLFYLQRPKLDEFDDYIFMIIHDLKYTDKLISSEVDIFLGKNFVVTFHWHPCKAIEDVRSRLEKSIKFNNQVDYLFYLIVNAQSERYFPIVDKLEDMVEKIENQALNNRNENILLHIKKTRSLANKIRKSLLPERELFNLMLRHDFEFISSSTRTYLTDVYDHLLRLFDLVEGAREEMTGVLDIHLSNTSNKLNEVMKVLTIISTIMMPLTLIAGIYGMNFKYMPELEFPYAYPLTLLFMVIIGIIMLIFFKKRKWL
jgi:magnesium transporter